MSIAYDIQLAKTQKITLRADIFNVLNFLNYKWGGYSQIINIGLCNVTVFNAATNLYKYSMNINAGTKVEIASYYSIPFKASYSFNKN